VYKNITHFKAFHILWKAFLIIKNMMVDLSKKEKLAIRKRIFLHLDGWALIPTIYNLNKLGVLQLLEENHTISLKDINAVVKTNEGYLNVALRLLASQGYILREVNNELDEITHTITATGTQAFEMADHYDGVYELMKELAVRPRTIISEKADLELIVNTWKELKNFSSYKDSTIRRRMSYHMEGVLLAPVMVGLGIEGRFDTIDTESILSATLLKLPQQTFDWFVEVLDQLLFVKKTDSKLTLNAKGLYYIKRASAYGVTVSYLPTFAQLDTLLKGDPTKLREHDEDGHETHVYRYMNVWGSGGAHSTYFKKVDEIIIALFNKPIAKQPKGIIDVGCGDGTFIEHVFNVIYTKTERGKVLNEHPLFIVGADYNKKARIATRTKMTKADIWAEIEFGDISDPKSLDEMLKDKHGIELGNLLNTRTFLDHNRIYKKPTQTNLKCQSSGAFSYRGRRIPNNELFQNLSDHLNKWSPYLKKHGLLIVELHSIKPKIAAENIGKTLSTPYDATHGYTDQYIIELNSFLAAAKHANLIPENEYSFKFPDDERATVSIHLLKAV